MCHLWGEQRCSPLFYACRKAGELRRIRLHPCFPAGEGEAPLVDKSCASPRPLLAKKLFFGPVLCPAIALWHQKKRLDAYKKDPFHPSGCVVYQTGSEGLRDVIGDVCLMPVSGPSPKSSAISFCVVTLTRLTPEIKKGRGKSPAALVSGDGLRPSQAQSRP